MKNSIMIIPIITILVTLLFCTGCGSVNTERDGINDPQSGDFQIPGLVVKADGEVIENGGVYYLPMTNYDTTREVTFTIENSGKYDLELEGALPVEMSWEGNSVITLEGQPDLYTIPPGLSASFPVWYSPEDLSAHSVYLSIETGMGIFTCCVCGVKIFDIIKDSDGAAGDNLGSSVFISGERAIVGIPGDENGKGSVYVKSFGAGYYKLISSDGAEGDHFGESVTISGDCAIVGAPCDDTNQGSAYVFTPDYIHGWAQIEKLTLPGSATIGDRFGCSVSMFDDRAIVGASGYNSSKGSAFLYYFSGSTWNFEEMLLAGDGAEGDNFGCSVSISSDRVIVGASGDDDNGDSSGSAYVYYFSGSGCYFEEMLLAGDGAEGDNFGCSVAISGDWAIVGASGDDDNGDSSGSAYVYHFTGITWEFVQKLIPSDNAEGDNFGISVSLSGDRAIVGASGDDDNGSDSGSVYVFHCAGSIWIEEQKVTDPDGAENDYYGSSVSLSGDCAIVGVPGDDENGTDSGSATVSLINSSSFYESKHTAADGAEYDRFGYSVSISGNWAIVGAYQDDDKGSNSGSVYMYQWNGIIWIFTQKLTAPDGIPNDYFGYSVSISGERAIVGAYQDDGNGFNSGSAYVYHWNGSEWELYQKLSASDRAEHDWFGYSVFLSGDRIIVGSIHDDDNGYNFGSAYIYHWNGSSWSQEQKLTASDGAENDNFGCSVSLYGDCAIVGAYFDDDNGASSGSAYVYFWDGSVWGQEQKLTVTDGAEYDNFGCSVSISGNWAIIGAAGHDPGGSAYVYYRNGNSFVHKQKLLAFDGSWMDEFGRSVCISGNHVIVGASGDDDNGDSSGSAYVYFWSGSRWVEDQKLTSSDGAESDYFGHSVSISGDHAIVGAYSDDDMGTDSGSVYFHRLLSP